MARPARVIGSQEEASASFSEKAKMPISREGDRSSQGQTQAFSALAWHADLSVR